MAYLTVDTPAGRVNAWRAAHLGYWRRRSATAEKTNQGRMELSSLFRGGLIFQIKDEILICDEPPG
jgi:hypothetical protein